MAESRIDELRRRLERDPESRLFAQLAEELRKDGEFEEAIGVARAGLQKHPNYPSARLTLGRALLDSGDPAAARAELESAVQGAPDNILASRLLGEALETLGDLGSALEQYQRTLQMAPGDGHVEARIRAIQTRLGAPEGPVESGEEPQVTTPVSPEDVAGAQEAEEEGGLPPTIRIRMPGDAPRPGRAPLPPAAGSAGEGRSAADAAEAGVATEDELVSSELPATLPMPGAERTGEEPEGEEAAAEGAGPREEADAGGGAPGEAAAGGESEVGHTSVAEGEGVEVLSPREAVPEAAPPAAETPQPEDAAPAAPGAEEAGAPEAEADGAALPEPELDSQPYPVEKRADSDLAPTLPKSRAAEYAVAGTELPPTLPPGVVTSVEEGQEAAVPEEAGGAAVPPAEPAAAAQAVTERMPPAEPAAAAQAVTERMTPPPEPTEAAVEPADAPPTGEGADSPESSPLSSATLAELYFEQGLLERAVEVYRQVLEEEPGNEGARGRLVEIEALVEEGAADLEVPATQDQDPDARRRALERTIERLEALLEVVRRR